MKEIIKHCSKRKNEEMGGVVLNDNSFLPLDNIAEDKENNFLFNLDGINYGDIKAIVHSHPNSDKFLSTIDRKHQVLTGLEWWIVKNDKIYKYPCVKHLRARLFEYGKADCGTIVEDAFTLYGLKLPVFERSSLSDDESQGKILKSLPLMGFERLTGEHIEMNVGDVIATSTGKDANHAMLYIGDEMVLHHVYGGLSKRSPIGFEIRRRIHSIWRHPKVKNDIIIPIENDFKASDL